MWLAWFYIVKHETGARCFCDDYQTRITLHAFGMQEKEHKWKCSTGPGHFSWSSEIWKVHANWWLYDPDLADALSYKVHLCWCWTVDLISVRFSADIIKIEPTFERIGKLGIVAVLDFMVWTMNVDSLELMRLGHDVLLIYKIPFSFVDISAADFFMHANSGHDMSESTFARAFFRTSCICVQQNYCCWCWIYSNLCTFRCCAMMPDLSKHITVQLFFVLRYL